MDPGWGLRGGDGVEGAAVKVERCTEAWGGLKEIVSKGGECEVAGQVGSLAREA